MEFRKTNSGFPRPYKSITIGSEFSPELVKVPSETRKNFVWPRETTSDYESRKSENLLSVSEKILSNQVPLNTINPRKFSKLRINYKNNFLVASAMIIVQPVYPRKCKSHAYPLKIASTCNVRH